MERREFAASMVAGAATIFSGRSLAQQRRGQLANSRRSVELRGTFPDDPHRPRYHFLPAKNWMNDPNGLLFYRGWYHLFYQHNPGAAVWGDMHWGHAISRDLLNWQHLPIALAPAPGGYDKDGVFSGCAVVNGDEPTLVYTGTKPEVQAIATSQHPRLESWTKFQGNPVIAGPPDRLNVTGFRDPFVWKESDEWLMALGSGLKGRGGAILLYRSTNLRTWEYLHPLVESDDTALGTMWECPNFFPLGDKHVLLFSPIPLRKALYAIGSYSGRKFLIETVGSLDDGGHFYAPQTFLDDAGRRVMFGWSWEGRSKEAQVEAGWAGAQTLPRVLALVDGNKLRMEPHPFCQRLTRFGTALRSVPLGDELNREIAAKGIRGNAGRLDIVLGTATAEDFELSFYRSPNGEEETRLVYSRRAQKLRIDRTKSSLDASQETKLFEAPLVLGKSETLNITLYLDRSMVEVYANGTCCMTTRVYPTRPDSLDFRIAGGADKTEVHELRWRPIPLRVS